MSLVAAEAGRCRGWSLPRLVMRLVAADAGCTVHNSVEYTLACIHGTMLESHNTLRCIMTKSVSLDRMMFNDHRLSLNN